MADEQELREALHREMVCDYVDAIHTLQQARHHGNLRLTQQYADEVLRCFAQLVECAVERSPDLRAIIFLETR